MPANQHLKLKKQFVFTLISTAALVGVIFEMMFTLYTLVSYFPALKIHKFENQALIFANVEAFLCIFKIGLILHAIHMFEVLKPSQYVVKAKDVLVVSLFVEFVLKMAAQGVILSFEDLLGSAEIPKLMNYSVFLIGEMIMYAVFVVYTRDVVYPTLPDSETEEEQEELSH